MCGILGGTQKNWNYQSALNAIQHRGPDASSLKEFENLTLGFNRLSIIDLSTSANQPMASADGQVWLCFNGEIYGYKKLKEQLIALGHIFKTSSDTEVLLASYLQWGDGWVEKADGMFAVAIYDRRNQSLRLFRDRPGIKPLYYFFNGQEFAFGSELKALLSLGINNLTIDYSAVYDFLTCKYIPTPKTLYKNIFKLPPAHKLVFDLRSKTLSVPAPYWKLEVGSDEYRDIKIESASDLVRQAIESSVEEQLVADVPVGFFLSGGIDSSILVASSARQHSNIKTFSIGFEKTKDSETSYASMVAREFQTAHHQKEFRKEELAENWEQLRNWFDEPFADLSAFPTYLVSAFAKEKVTVALSGDGGDEVFGGYRSYQQFLWQKNLGILKNSPLGNLFSIIKKPFQFNYQIYKIIDALSGITSGELPWFVKLMGGLTADDKSNFRERFEIANDYDDYWHFRKYWRTDLPIRTRLQYLDFHTFLSDDILTKVDRTSMAVSLETRVPLLSRRVIETSFKFPEEIRFYGGQLKGLLKFAYQNELPKMIIERSKKGFGVPTSYYKCGSKKPQELVLEKVFGDFNVR
jgi:asparagine synthase (glutamine-hydrolysing)